MQLLYASLSIVIIAILTMSGPARANEPLANPAITEVMKAYRSCVAAGTAKAAGMKTPRLREKVFNGQMIGCERSRIAGLEVVAEHGEQAELQAQIAAITEGLINAAKSDLGL